MPPELNFCKRTACCRPLDRGHYEIHNDPSTDMPSLYCISCGRKIIEHNQQMVAAGQTDIELRYSVLDRNGNVIRTNSVSHQQYRRN